MPSEFEVPILQILYPPDGSIPAAHVDKVSAIRQHISALAALAGDGQAPKRSKCIHDRQASAALDAKIIELRETPLPDGGVRTWDLISEVLGRQITALAARKRYAAAKKKKLEFEKLVEAALVKPREGLPLGNPKDEPDELRPEGEPPQAPESNSSEVEPEAVPEAAPPGYLESLQIKESAPLTDKEIDAELIRLRDMGLSPKEIQNSMLHKGVDFGLAELRDRLAALARKALLGKAGPSQLSGLPADAIPPGLNRQGLDVVMWRLWDHGKGKTPDEISDLLCNQGYSYGTTAVERRLRQQGAKL